MQIKKITCIQFYGEFPDFCSRLVMPDFGLPLIGTILSEMGYDVKVYVERIKPPEWDRIAVSDLIFFHHGVLEPTRCTDSPRRSDQGLEFP